MDQLDRRHTLSPTIELDAHLLVHILGQVEDILLLGLLLLLLMLVVGTATARTATGTTVIASSAATTSE